MDTIYKWKPIKGENHEFVVVMENQTHTSSITSTFGGSNLSAILQAITCWEAPTPTYIIFLQANVRECN